jgi:outer membrane protein TolC
MFLTRLKNVVTLATVLGIACGGAAVFAGRDPVKQRAEAQPKAEKQSSEEMAKLKVLLQERAEALREAFRIRFEEYKVGRATLEGILEIEKELGTAELELAEKREERISILENNVKIQKAIEALTKEKYDAGRITMAAVALSKAARLEAEIVLQRERMKNKPSPK